MAALPNLQIRSSLANYTVAFSDLGDLSQWCPQADALLVDAFFRDRLVIPEALPVIWVEATEEAKALEATLPVFVALKQAGFGRGSHLAAIGGGVVQDIATFVASLYMRGISWSYVPTTVLGMADSCLGGKSSINVGPYKNLIGNFHPPRRIDILPVFARTLPPVELAGGAAEAAKIAFCRGPEAFAAYEQLAAPVLNGSWTEQQLADLLHATLAVKQWFIETDEFDRAERRLLNFGHTWGHALESATGFAIPHGLAVAVGMMASIRFVAEMDGEVVAPDLWRHCLALLRPVLQPEQLARFQAERFTAAFQADKKHSSGQFHLIVPNRPAAAGLGVREIQLPADGSSLEAVLTAMRQALHALSQELGSLSPCHSNPAPAA
jgi:3-dehydroquinate synthase